MHNNLKQLHDGFVEGMQATAAFFESPEGEAAIDLMILQSSRIVSLLVQATQKPARADGWTLLSSAGHFIAANDPEQLPSIERRFGQRGLRSLVAAADLFELREEAIANGGTRTIYRVRPGA